MGRRPCPSCWRKPPFPSRSFSVLLLFPLPSCFPLSPSPHWPLGPSPPGALATHFQVPETMAGSCPAPTLPPHPGTREPGGYLLSKHGPSGALTAASLPPTPLAASFLPLALLRQAPPLCQPLCPTVAHLRSGGCLTRDKPSLLSLLGLWSFHLSTLCGSDSVSPSEFSMESRLRVLSSLQPYPFCPPSLPPADPPPGSPSPGTQRSSRARVEGSHDAPSCWVIALAQRAPAAASGPNWA